MNAAAFVVAGDVMEHELVAVDHFGKWCTCRQPFTPEHLYAVAAAALNAPESLDDYRARKTQLAHARKAARVVERLARARAVLVELQAENDRLVDELDRLGIVDLTDRADWLATHRRYPRRYNSAGERITTWTTKTTQAS